MRRCLLCTRLHAIALGRFRYSGLTCLIVAHMVYTGKCYTDSLLK
jgi:hypothetical protein